MLSLIFLGMYLLCSYRWSRHTEYHHSVVHQHLNEDKAHHALL